MAFLTVLTCHLPGRAALLARNQASLQAPTDLDYDQRVMTDFVRSGFEHVRDMMRQAAQTLPEHGYVLILDDDDVMSNPRGIETLKVAARDNPPAVIFRGQHADLGVLPKHAWQTRPACGDIGSFDFILRVDVFRACVAAETQTAYAYDHAIIAAAYDAYPGAVVWCDHVICAADKRRIGKDD